MMIVIEEWAKCIETDAYDLRNADTVAASKRIADLHLNSPSYI